MAEIGATTNIQTANNTKSPNRAGVMCRTFTMNLPMSASDRRLFDWPCFDYSNANTGAIPDKV